MKTTAEDFTDMRHGAWDQYEDYSRPTLAELDAEEASHAKQPTPVNDPAFEAWLIEQFKVECAGCGTAFNSACEVCHPF